MVLPTTEVFMAGQSNGEYQGVFTLFNEIQHKEEACEAGYRQPLTEYDHTHKAAAAKAWDKNHPVLAQLEEFRHKLVVSVTEHVIEHQCTIPANKERTALGSQLSGGLFR